MRGIVEPCFDRSTEFPPSSQNPTQHAELRPDFGKRRRRNPRSGEPHWAGEGVEAADVRGENFTLHGEAGRQNDAGAESADLLVIGQTTTNDEARKKSLAERTSAGRRPLCSRPVRGSKSVQMRSPASGT